MTVFNAYIFECCNDSNYIDIYMYIIHIYIVVFFHPVHGPLCDSLRSWVVGPRAAVGGVALLAVMADLRIRACPPSRRMIFLREALRAVAADLKLRGSPLP